MAKINFSIKHRPQIESGEYKVETRDGRHARIICWDLNDRKYIIVAAAQNGDGTNDVMTYTDKGNFLHGMEHEFDLFLITPEPELSEDERIRKEIISALKSANDGGVYDKYIAYLEKQKESLHISETCKENADSFTDEDESFKKFAESVKALVEAVEGYVCPKKGDKYVSRTEVLVKCNELKKLLGI